MYINIRKNNKNHNNERENKANQKIMNVTIHSSNTQ